MKTSKKEIHKTKHPNRWHKWGYQFGKALGWIILGFIAYWVIWAIATLGFIINEVNRM